MNTNENVKWIEHRDLEGNTTFHLVNPKYKDQFNKRKSRHQLVERVVALFNQGYNTKQIAKLVNVKERVVLGIVFSSTE